MSEGGDGAPPGAAGRLARKVTIVGELGLHARPAARFVKCASEFDAEIEVTCNGVTVSGHSILGLMMLAAAGGSELLISASGREAAAALDALAALVAGGFE